MAIKLTTYYRSEDIPDLPGTNTFHSKDLFKSYENTKGYKPFMIVASENEVILGKILATLRKKITYFILPTPLRKCEIYGIGEYFCPEDEIPSLYGEILKHLTTEALRKAFVIEFRNLSNALEGYKVFRDNSYFPINWLRVRNDLRLSEPIESTFSESRARQIKKGLKNGAIVKEAKTSEEIEQFAKLLRKIYSTHVRRHYPSIEFFQHIKNNLIDTNKRKATFYIVTYKEKVIGGAACAFSEQEAYLWFSGGMNKIYSQQSPGVLAVWKALTDCKAKGYTHLEFMDVGLPFRKHTYREFVLRFGGKQSGTRRWFRFRWRWLNALFNKFAD